MVKKENFDLGIVHVMQRLVDKMRRDIALVYEAEGLEFESRWYPVLLVLWQKGPLGVMQIAREIGYAHPSVVNLVAQLEKELLVQAMPDFKDKRRKQIHLTPKAEMLLVRLAPVWTQIAEVNRELGSGKNRLLDSLNKLEQDLKQQSYFDRIQNKR